MTDNLDSRSLGWNKLLDGGGFDLLIFGFGDIKIGSEQAIEEASEGIK
jgi:hypothetical protein